VCYSEWGGGVKLTRGVDECDRVPKPLAEVNTCRYCLERNHCALILGNKTRRDSTDVSFSFIFESIHKQTVESCLINCCFAQIFFDPIKLLFGSGAALEKHPPTQG